MLFKYRLIFARTTHTKLKRQYDDVFVSNHLNFLASVIFFYKLLWKFQNIRRQVYHLHTFSDTKVWNHYKITTVSSVTFSSQLPTWETPYYRSVIIQLNSAYQVKIDIESITVTLSCNKLCTKYQFVWKISVLDMIFMKLSFYQPLTVFLRCRIFQLVDYAIMKLNTPGVLRRNPTSLCQPRSL